MKREVVTAMQAKDAVADRIHEKGMEIERDRDQLRAENERLREALAQIDVGQSEEPDHWQFRCRVRGIARAALQHKAGE